MNAWQHYKQSLSPVMLEMLFSTHSSIYAACPFEACLGVCLGHRPVACRMAACNTAEFHHQQVKCLVQTVLTEAAFSCIASCHCTCNCRCTCSCALLPPSEEAADIPGLSAAAASVAPAWASQSVVFFVKGC